MIRLFLPKLTLTFKEQQGMVSLRYRHRHPWLGLTSHQGQSHRLRDGTVFQESRAPPRFWRLL